jgi:hypothetical protein
MEEIKAAGLKWRKLASGKSPVWVADEADVKAGYTPKTVNLKNLADDPDMLVARCNALQADMLLWRTGFRRDPLAFDGTVRSVLDIYEIHERSPYRKLKPGSRKPYNHYLGKLKGMIGPVRLNDISGVEIMEWYDVWSDNGAHLAAAATALAVLEASISFGIMLRKDGCAALSVIIKETRKKLPKPRPRKARLTVEQVIAARQAAHADGRPACALAYAIAFETTLRLWDVIGQWLPIDWIEMSDVVDADRNQKWIGARWEHVDANMRINYTPSKTENRTGATISYPLAHAPMVMEELAYWPMEKRVGPMIVSEKTGQPYRELPFQKRWQKDRKTAGIPANVWARDLRASGISEGRASDVSKDDAAKVAGHTSVRTTEIYDRAVIEATDRFAKARVKGRIKGDGR